MKSMILLMEEILHQLRLVVYTIMLQGFFYIPGGCLGFLFINSITRRDSLKLHGSDKINVF